MSTLRLRQILWASAALFAAGTPAVLYLALTLPCEVPEPRRAKREAPERAPYPRPEPRARISPVDLASLELRQRLFEPPPEPPAPVRPKAKKALPAVRLVGTVLSDRPTVLLSFQGSVVFKRPGDLVGDDSNSAKVLAIEADRVTLEHEGEVVVVTRDGVSR